MTRRTTKRESLENRAARVIQLFSAPDFMEAYNATRDMMVADIERCVLDGTPERERAALELVRKLQTLTAIRAVAMQPVAAVRLKEARERGGQKA